jgi:hypothetical protein
MLQVYVPNIPSLLDVCYSKFLPCVHEKRDRCGCYPRSGAGKQVGRLASEQVGRLRSSTVNGYAVQAGRHGRPTGHPDASSASLQHYFLLKR